MAAAETGRAAQGSRLLEPSPTWRTAMAGALVGALLTSLALAAMPGGRGFLGAAVGFERAASCQQVASSARQWPSRPLPREWRWSPPGVDLRQMFRQPR